MTSVLVGAGITESSCMAWKQPGRGTDIWNLILDRCHVCVLLFIQEEKACTAGFMSAVGKQSRLGAVSIRIKPVNMGDPREASSTVTLEGRGAEEEQAKVLQRRDRKRRKKQCFREEGLINCTCFHKRRTSGWLLFYHSVWVCVCATPMWKGRFGDHWLNGWAEITASTYNSFPRVFLWR